MLLPPLTGGLPTCRSSQHRHPVPPLPHAGPANTDIQYLLSLMQVQPTPTSSTSSPSCASCSARTHPPALMPPPAHSGSLNTQPPPRLPLILLLLLLLPRVRPPMEPQHIQPPPHTHLLLPLLPLLPRAAGPSGPPACCWTPGPGRPCSRQGFGAGRTACNSRSSRAPQLQLHWAALMALMGTAVVPKELRGGRRI